METIKSQVDKLVIELEQSRNLSSTIVHIDMDAFYAAVEMRDNPELKEKPIAVGSMNKDDMNMSAKFNEGEVSSSPVLFEDSTSPMDSNLQQSGLSVENSVVFGTSAEEAVKEIRFRIEQKTQLTASAGIAPNTMLAKMCSDRNKPNGQYRIAPERLAVLEFLKDLPIRKVPGIGKVTEKMLKALGIVTCSELYQQRALLSLLFSEISWRNFLDISLGLGSTHLEKTFSEIKTAEDQYSLCRELCRDLAQELQKEGLKGKTVTLKLKNVNFEVKTRASTVLSSVSTEEEIFTVAKDLLGTEIDSVAPQPLRIRLMGVRVSGFLTEEEKKYQQKSITSFLKSGKEIGFLRLQTEKSNQEYLTKNSEAPHRGSFFDQKRAARLNSENISPNESRSKQVFHDDRSSANFVEEETNKVTDLQNSNVCKIFTCPVCFEKQSSNNLEELNRHIDECLNGMCLKDTVEISKNDRSRENTPNFLPQFENEYDDKCQKK
ncbi:hypothetical protein DUI87_06763 [Hirundo rustica rustica]|uniref:DNA polymerase kappa n=1 Tax=Hirundo rustica rustica TaxID=333673 RepID=A0A3M0KTD9_HIRRU|nr:hypothetical protein DUI87_06763 [Hirundo rustica rustica]